MVASINGNTQNHGADVFGGGGFEEVGTAAGAVTDVITDQVGNNSGIAGIIFGNTGFNLTHQVSAHISSLGINTAAELSEEGYEAGAETEAEDQVRSDIRMAIAAIGEEDNGNTDQAEDYDQEAGNSSTAQSCLDCFIQALLRSSGAAAVGFDGNDHADETGYTGADGAHQEGYTCPPGKAEGG